MVLRDCLGRTSRLDGFDASSSALGTPEPQPLVMLFLDADSPFSQSNYFAFRNIAQKYPSIHFAAILSFGLGFNREVCHASGVPSYATEASAMNLSNLSLLLDKHGFYNGKFAYEYFAVSANEVLMYTPRGERFRYMPYTQADMTHILGRTWVVTAIEELHRVSVPTNTYSQKVLEFPYYLTAEFDHFDRFTVGNAGVVGKMVAATDAAACKRQCVASSCTGFVMLGLHECIFFASHGRALKHLREKYDNAQLFVRRPVSNVLAPQQAFQGFLWGLLIIVTAILVFTCATKANSNKGSLDIQASMGLGSINDVEGGATALMKSSSAEDPGETELHPVTVLDETEAAE